MYLPRTPLNGDDARGINECTSLACEVRSYQRASLARIPQTVSEVEGNEAVDDEGAEDEIWAVTHITEDDELENEVGQDEEDVVSTLLELAQWEYISVEEQ